MDASRFDALVRCGFSRRATLGASLVGGLAVLLDQVQDDVAARRKRKRNTKKRKQRCQTPCGQCERCQRGACLPLQDGEPCGNNGVCDGGECVCEKAACGDVCVDLLNDDEHCGACNSPCPAGQRCLHGTCTCDPFNNTCPNNIDGQCTCGAVVADEFTAACVDRNSACDLDRPCDTHEDCPPDSVCLLGCADPPATNPRRCSKPCVAV
jgi:hypothetical protein